MTRTELIIQLLKVAIALAFGAYFVWWSLQVLDRLTPEYDAASAMVGPIFEFKRVARPGVIDIKTGHRLHKVANARSEDRWQERPRIDCHNRL
jgi:hypothetical protein